MDKLLFWLGIGAAQKGAGSNNHRQRQRRLADHPWQCGYAGAALGKHAAERERHDEQGKDHGCQSDGAARENACYRVGDTGRKDTACQFGYSVCCYPGGVALVLADQSI
jgi:hypothetical protein